MKKQQGKGRIRKLVSLEDLEQLNLNAAGLDVGDDEIWACVPEGRAVSAVRVFGTFTVDLYALADWLAECGVDTVAVESTGVYWIPVYEVLEGRGFEVCLVNARHVKKMGGRKTDLLDCQWLRQLHTYGLLKASFRPPEDICALRAIGRQRDTLIHYRAKHIQHMQKALQQMNVKLTNVLSDVTGTTGMAIIRAILSGERDPLRLAALRNAHCAKSEAEIAKSLEGNWREEHLFALKQAVEFYDYHTQQIAACDLELERRYAEFEPEVDVVAKPLQPKKRQRNQPEGNAPAFDLRTHLYQLTGVDLTQIDGIDALTAHNVLCEIGLDMNKWPTVKHFTSWLCLAPFEDKSGGRILRSGVKKTRNRANLALRRAAQSLHHSHSALGAFYRRIAARHGASTAIAATAHKLARIIYHMLKNKVEYVDLGQDYYDVRARSKAIHNLKRRAKLLGFEVVPVTA